MLKPLRAIWNARTLVLELARRDIQQRHRGSFLGPIWRLIHPLFQLTIYTFLFSVVFRVPWPNSPASGFLGKALLFYCGFAPVVFFTECIGRAPSLIIGSPNYVKKVVFPLEVLPVSAAMGGLFQLAINVLVILVAHVLSGGRIGWTLLLLPVVMLPLVLLVLGSAWLLSSLGVLVRDVSHGLGLMLQLVPWVTPIFYPVEALPRPMATLLRLNPLTSIVEGFRNILLWGIPPNWGELAIWIVAASLVFVAGFRWFTYTRVDFADVI
jgi:lipopolysaccharide transport system permease protein